MKTRKKMLYISILGVFLFTFGCMYLNTIDKPLPESLVDKFYTYCTWIVVGSGVCGVTSKRNDRIKELHNTSSNDKKQDNTNNEEVAECTEGEEIMHDINI